MVGGVGVPPNIYSTQNSYLKLINNKEPKFTFKGMFQIKAAL